MSVTTCSHEESGVRCHHEATKTIEGAIYCAEHAPDGCAAHSANPALDEIAVALA